MSPRKLAILAFALVAGAAHAQAPKPGGGGSAVWVAGASNAIKYTLGHVQVQGTAAVPNAFDAYTSGTLGTVANVHFFLGDNYVAGVGLNAFAIEYQDDSTAKKLILSLEQSGTLATVGDSSRRSAFETYFQSGTVNPAFRLSSYSPGNAGMALELGPGGTSTVAGNATCSSNVVTVGPTVALHQFTAGQPLIIVSGDAKIHQDLTGATTVATVVDGNNFTYNATCTNGASTSTIWFSQETDWKIRRLGGGTLAFVYGPYSNEAYTPLLLYPTAVTVQSGTDLSLNGGLLVASTTVTNASSPVTMGGVLTYLCNATAGGVTMTLPAAGSQLGRTFTVIKTDSTANACTVTRAGSDTIQGATTYPLSIQYAAVTVAANGSATWLIESSGNAGTTWDATHLRVGINSTAPSTGVEMHSAEASIPVLTIESTVSNGYGGIQFMNSSGTETFGIGTGSSGGAANYQGPYMFIGSGQTLNTIGNTTLVHTIDSSGNSYNLGTLAVGSTNSVYAGNMQINKSTNAGVGAELWLNNPNNTTGSKVQIDFNADATTDSTPDGILVFNNTAGNFQGTFAFQLWDGATIANRWAVDPSGNTTQSGTANIAAASANNVSISGNTTGNNPLITAANSSDTNVNLAIAAKGTGNIQCNSRFKAGNGILNASTGKTADYTATVNDYFVGYTTLAASRVVTLPAAAASNTGQTIVVKDESGSCAGGVTITVQVSGGGNIDGAATVVLNTAYATSRVFSNGTQWYTW